MDPVRPFCLLKYVLPYMDLSLDNGNYNYFIALIILVSGITTTLDTLVMIVSIVYYDSIYHLL